jgi:two-component sensor histidine kinase
VKRPKRHGFGLELINSVFANSQGTVDAEFRPEGVVYDISFAVLPEVSQVTLQPSAWPKTSRLRSEAQA